MKRDIIFLLAVLVVLFSCSKDKTGTSGTEDTSNVSYIVVNEGNYGKGTADISVVYKDGSADWNMFEKTNGRPLGDVAQYIECMNEKYYITLNNSKKIEVVDRNTFKSTATIVFDTDKKSSPTYIAQINKDEAVISDYGKQLTKINLNNDKIVEYISLSAQINKMKVVDNKLFGASGNTIVVFDCNNISQGGMRTVKGFENEKGDALSTYQSAKIIKGADGALWVLANSDSKAYLVKIDVVKESVVERINLMSSVTGSSISAFPFFPRLDADKDCKNLFFTAENESGNAVYCYNIESKRCSLYKQMKEIVTLYGMGISPDGDVIALDCVDYSQRGYVRAYGDQGVKDIRVGVNPRMVHFRYYDSNK